MISKCSRLLARRSNYKPPNSGCLQANHDTAPCTQPTRRCVAAVQFTPDEKRFPNVYSYQAMHPHDPNTELRLHTVACGNVAIPRGTPPSDQREVSPSTPAPGRRHLEFCVASVRTSARYCLMLQFASAAAVPGTCQCSTAAWISRGGTYEPHTSSRALSGHSLRACIGRASRRQGVML